MDGAASMIWSWNGAQLTGMEAAKGSDQGMGAAIERIKWFGGSDDRGVASVEGLSRVNIWLSRHYESEQDGFAWLMSLLDGLSLPKSSAGTSDEKENTSELSAEKCRECEVNEEACS